MSAVLGVSPLAAYLEDTSGRSFWYCCEQCVTVGPVGVGHRSRMREYGGVIVAGSGYASRPGRGDAGRGGAWCGRLGLAIGRTWSDGICSYRWSHLLGSRPVSCSLPRLPDPLPVRRQCHRIEISQ